MNAHPWLGPLSVVVAVTASLLAIPFIAMQFTQEVSWSAADFTAGALLLLTAGAAIVGGVRRAATGRGKAAVVAAVVLLLMLVWAELAVGLLS